MPALLLRLLAYTWAAPNSFLGVLCMPLALCTGGGVRRVDGTLEVYGGLPAWLLRHGTPLKGGAAALTLGHVVVGCTPEVLDHCRCHEHVHVRQYERWGPFFIPAYGLASLWVWLRGQDAYRDNPFEREAYALDTPAIP